MKKNIKKIYFLLDKNNKFTLFYVFLITILSSLFELIGVVSLLPFLSLIVEPSLVNDNKYLIFINSYLNLSTAGLIIFFGFLFFILMLLNQILRFTSKIYTIYFTRNLIYEMTNKVFAHYLNQPYSFFIKQNNQYLIQKCTSYVEHLIAGTLTPYLMIFAQVLTTFIILCFLIYYQPAIIISLSIILIGYYFIIYKSISKKYNILAKNYSNYFKGFSSTIGDAFGVIQQLKFSNSKYFNTKFNIFSKLYRDGNIKQNFFGILPTFIIESLAYGSILIIAIILFFQSSDLKNIIPILGIITISLRRIIPGLQEVYLQILQIRYHSGIFDKIYNDLKKASKINLFKKKNKIIIFNKKIEIKNLSYQYKKSKTFVNISTSFSKGMFMGVCGKTGIGKTTFINMLTGLIESKSGQIFCDGKLIQIYNNDQWKKKFGFVPQNRYIINDTIANNISLGTHNKKNFYFIKKLCKIVDLNNQIKKYKNKYSTFIGDSGIKLSGGQEQKIVIARALYSQPEILIFDEGTNALDSFSEKKIISSIKKNFPKITIIFITHRIDSLKKCDQVLFIKNSRLDKRNKYLNLIKKKNNLKKINISY